MFRMKLYTSSVQVIVEKSVNGVSRLIVVKTWEKKRNGHGLGQPVNLLRNHGFSTSLFIANWEEKDQNIPKLRSSLKLSKRLKV